MFPQIKNNKFLLFLVKAGFLYTLCYVLYEFVIKIYTRIDQYFIRKIINLCTFLLNSIGYKTFASKEVNDFQVFGIDGSNGVWIGGPCNGITLMFLFAIFVVSYPGQLKKKLWFIPLGVLIIYIVNIIRIIILSIIALKAPQYLEFNHTYTFTFITYGIVFLLWMIWVNKFSEKTNGNEKMASL